MHKNRTNQNRHLQPRGYYVQILVGKSSVDQDIKKWDTVIVCSIFHIAVPESLTLRKIPDRYAPGKYEWGYHRHDHGYDHGVRIGRELTGRL